MYFTCPTNPYTLCIYIQMTTNLFFRDPYILDFLDLKDDKMDKLETNKN